MDVIIQRGKVSLLEELPFYSLALDGFVSGPQIDSKNHRYSLDHHSGVLRFCTLATCQQAWTVVNAGLDPTGYTIYANDADADVCMAVWTLRNPDGCNNPQAKKLIDAIGTLDMHAGAISVNGMTRAVEWVSAPETDSKRTGDYEKLSDSGLYSIMEAVLHRIDLYVDGNASSDVQKQPKHGEMKIIRTENDWVMVESPDPHIFSAIYQAGYNKLLIYRHLNDGSNAITIAKRSDFVDNFHLDRMVEELNKLEPGWGGGSSIIGAPRNRDGSRSRLPLETIVKVVDACI